MKIELAPEANFLESSLVEALVSVLDGVTYTYGEMSGNPRDFYSREAAFVARRADGSTATVEMRQNLRGEGDPETYCRVDNIEVAGPSAPDIIAKLTPALEAARVDTPRRRLRIDQVETRGDIPEPAFLKALTAVIGDVKRDYSDAIGNPRDFFDRDAMFTATHEDLTIVTVTAGQNMWSPTDDGAFTRLRMIDIRGPLPIKNCTLAGHLRTALAAIGVATTEPVEEVASQLPSPPTETPPPPPRIEPLWPWDPQLSDALALAAKKTALPHKVGDASFLAPDQHVVNGEVLEVLIDLQNWCERPTELFAVAPNLRAVHFVGLIGRGNEDDTVLLERLRVALASPFLPRVTGLAIPEIGRVYRDSMWDMAELHSLGKEATEILVAANLEHIEVLEIQWSEWQGLLNAKLPALKRLYLPCTNEERAMLAEKLHCTVEHRPSTGSLEWFY